MHTAEISLRTNILGEPARQNVRPLSETKAIENGANALAESFLFAVAALLILGESYRSSSKQSKRRDDVDDKLETLTGAVERLEGAMIEIEHALERAREQVEGERTRREALERVVQRLVLAGVAEGAHVWDGTPLAPPTVEMVCSSDGSSSSDTTPPSPLTPP